MEYVETAAPVALSRHVQCLWRLRDRDPSASVHTVYPDGRCELILHMGMPLQIQSAQGTWQAQSQSLFAAQTRQAIKLRAVGALDCLGVRLQPAASAALLRQADGGVFSPLSDLADGVHDLHRLDLPLAQALQRSLAAGDDAVSPAFLAQLCERLGSIALDSRIERACALLDQALGCLPIGALAETLGMSLRALQARFLAAVGLTAKEYARIQRLQATIRELDRGHTPLAQIALSAGFADQAHATRALRSFSGLTPAALRRALKAERNGELTLAMAAAFVRGTSR